MKRKSVLYIVIGILVICIVSLCSMILKDDKKESVVIPVQEAIIIRDNFWEKNIYSNLQFKHFEFELGDICELYKIEVHRDLEYKNRTLLDNYSIMNDVINRFFGESLDKSYLTADLYYEGEETLHIDYNDITAVCDEKHSNATWVVFFGNNTKEGGNMVQIDSSLGDVWFSKYGLKSIYPSSLNAKKVYHYVLGKRVEEDDVISLKDGKIKLSELEGKALEFLNHNFIMEVPENISFSIANAKLIENGDYEGISFLIRRNYKGIPYEYGASTAMGEFIDKVNHDSGEVAYVENSSPDTILSFGHLQGTIVETDRINEMISIDEAVRILSERIGDNSVYDVHGIELVYRECEVPQEQFYEVEAILKPVWKFITINQNDNKYTLFYVDVVTGEITQRFEYYYE